MNITVLADSDSAFTGTTDTDLSPVNDIGEKHCRTRSSEIGREATCRRYLCPQGLDASTLNHACLYDERCLTCDNTCIE